MPKTAADAKTQSRIARASLLLRVGLALVFLYAAVDAFREPDSWIYFIPTFIDSFLDPKIALDILSVAQIVLAGWLLWGKFAVASAGIAALFLVGIMVTNVDSLLVTFRDIGLVFAAVTIIILER